MSDIDESAIELPIEWNVPDNLITRYANNMIIQHGRNEFIVSFFESYPPIILGDNEHVKAQLEEKGHITAQCISRVVVSPRKMKQFIQVLQGNFDKYVERFGDVGDSDE